MPARRASRQDRRGDPGAGPELPQAEVDKLLASGYNAAVNIKHRVPVHTAYFTAVADDAGQDHDLSATSTSSTPPVAAAIIGKQAKPEAVADNVEATRRRRRRSQAGAQAERKLAAAFAGFARDARKPGACGLQLYSCAAARVLC